MATVTRNAFKGYSYQDYVYLFLLGKMDTEREIKSMEAEVPVPHNMDDIEIKTQSNTIYRLQIKNYINLAFGDITIEEDKVIINDNTTAISKEINVFILNGCDMEYNDTILGIPAYRHSDTILFISLTPSEIEDVFGGMFNNDSRALQIVHLSKKICASGEPYIDVSKLPPLSFFSKTLSEETVFLRETIVNVNKGIFAVIGKPGVGKSHFVNELEREYPEAHIYRFWVNAQDKDLHNRLIFKSFLEDIACQILKSSKRTSYEKIVQEINDKNLLLFIDGLDHVENYNPQELEKYLNFINDIANARVVVFTRPLKQKIMWNNMVLDNWGKTEVLEYLSIQHGINDYLISENTFKASKGYPIITSYLASHYLNNGSINISTEISDIDDYYMKLLETTDTKKPLTIFAINTTYFTYEEIDLLLDDISATLIQEFIESYPYLFEMNLNRISLIHDSFNSFLQRNEGVENIRTSLLEQISSSIANEEIRYFSRFNSFGFDLEIITKTIKQYSSLNRFTAIAKSTYDWESVTAFYSQLKSILEFCPDLLDIYEYYEFILVILIVERNDFFGCEELLYQQILYLNNHRIDHVSIFSSGMLWSMFLYSNHGNSEVYRRLLDSKRYHYNLDKFKDSIEDEENYFDTIGQVFDVDAVMKYLNNDDVYYQYKLDVFSDYIVNCYIHKIDDDGYYSLMKQIIEGRQSAILKLIRLAKIYDADGWFAKSIHKKILYKLKTLGVLKEDNELLTNSLEEIINLYAPSGSFGVYSKCLDYIRLANYEKREIDMDSLYQYYFMYYRRKDYSVLNLPVALVQFEEVNLINYKASIEIIEKVMEQSEKGIRHLMNEYIELKSVEFIPSLIHTGILEKDNSIRLMLLPAEIINSLPTDYILEELWKFLNRHHRSKSVDFYDIESILLSQYQILLLETLKRHSFKVINTPKSKVDTLSNVDYLLSTQENVDKEYEPFKHHAIHEDDIQFIIEQKIDCVEVSSYTDGWYHCFAILDIYNHYDNSELQAKLLQIIHTAMYSKVKSIGQTGNWYYFLGNLPKFLSDINYTNIDFRKLFDSFKRFLITSKILSEEE